MSKRVTFAQFDAILEELGFRKSVVTESHVNYRRAAGDTPLMVRLHKPNEFVPDYELAYVRHELEWSGIIEPANFDEKLLAVAA